MSTDPDLQLDTDASATARGQAQLFELGHHLPVELDLLEDGLAARFAETEHDAFRRFARISSAHWGVELQDELVQLRQQYRPFDPSRDTARPANEDASPAARDRFVEDLGALLVGANYRELERAELERALDAVSPHGVQVEVDLAGLAVLRVFARGHFHKTVVARRWPRREVETEGYRRFFMIVATNEKPTLLHLRLFKDVASTDLEMFLPNTKVCMRTRDKVMLGITGGGGTVGGVAATVTKIGAATTPTGWAVAIAGFGGVVWRQVSKVFHHRTRYMAQLSQALWFHGLDNDLGALVHVVQMATQEHAKEALLAWALIATSPGQSLDPAGLDRAAEQHLAEVHGVVADFDVADGLAKLEALGLLTHDRAGRLTVLDASAALARLDKNWDRRFGPAPDIGSRS